MLFVLIQKKFCKPEQREDNSYNLPMGQSKFSYVLYSQIIKENRKKPIFASLPILFLSTFSECKGVSRASSDRTIYFNKN